MEASTSEWEARLPRPARPLPHQLQCDKLREGRHWEGVGLSLPSSRLRKLGRDGRDDSYRATPQAGMDPGDPRARGEHLPADRSLVPPAYESDCGGARCGGACCSADGGRCLLWGPIIAAAAKRPSQNRSNTGTQEHGDGSLTHSLFRLGGESSGVGARQWEGGREESGSCCGGGSYFRPRYRGGRLPGPSPRRWWWWREREWWEETRGRSPRVGYRSMAAHRAAPSRGRGAH